MLKLALRARLSCRFNSKRNSSICVRSEVSFSSTSLPVIPSKPEPGSSLISSTKLPPLKNKRKGPNPKFNSSASDPEGAPFEFAREKKPNFKQFNDSPVNLYAIYGNILAKEPQLLHRFSQQDPLSSLSYPFDEALSSLFQSSSRLWYENGHLDTRLPGIVVIEGPSRRATWEAAQLFALTGNSHLALIPFSLFYELFHRYTAVLKQQSENAKKSAVFAHPSPSQDFSSILNKALILNPKGKGFSIKNENLPVIPSREQNPQSRSVVSIVEYLFACFEACLGSPDAAPNERFTLFVDGAEDFLISRRGGEVALRDLTAWAQENGRHLILGTRSATEPVSAANTSSTDEPKPDESSPQENNPPPAPANSKNVVFQLFESLFKSDAHGNAAKGPSMEPNQSVVNVRMESGALRLQVSPPALDRRRRLLFSQLQSSDRLSDILDANLIQLRSLASYRWKRALKLSGMPSKHAHPSEQAHLRELLLSAGRGLLGKRRLSREELNELLILALGRDETGCLELNEFSLAHALSQTASLRHDPSRMSSDDLSHLLAERHVSDLNKYERRFLNCIATGTTQTYFKDVAVPAETSNALRALTSLPLSHPELFSQGILKQSLTGVLLFGPPGTGKTMLARAVAQESGAAFLAVNMSNIFDMWVGEGEKNVKVSKQASKFSYILKQTSFLGNVYFGQKVGSLHHFY